MEKLLESFVRKVDLHTQTDDGAEEVAQKQTMCHLLSIAGNPKSSTKIVSNVLHTIGNVLRHNVVGYLENEGVDIILEVLKHKTHHCEFTDLDSAIVKIIELTPVETASALNKMHECEKMELCDIISDLFCKGVSHTSCVIEIKNIMVMLCIYATIRTTFINNDTLIRLAHLNCKCAHDTKHLLTMCMLLMARPVDVETFCNNGGIEKMIILAEDLYSAREEETVDSDNIISNLVCTIQKKSYGLVDYYINPLQMQILESAIQIETPSYKSLCVLFNIESFRICALKKNSVHINHFIMNTKEQIQGNSFLVQSSIINEIIQSYCSCLSLMQSTNGREILIETFNTMPECTNHAGPFIIATHVIKENTMFVSHQLCEKVFSMLLSYEHLQNDKKTLWCDIFESYEAEVQEFLTSFLHGEREALIPIYLMGDSNIWEHKLMQNICKFIPPSTDYPRGMKTALMDAFQSYFSKYGNDDNISKHNYMMDLYTKYGIYNELNEQCTVCSSLETIQTCPITLQGFRYPVVASDGNTYEFQAIVEHFFSQAQQAHFTSPMTREQLEYTMFYNRSVMEFNTKKVLSFSPTRRIRHKRRFDTNKCNV